jgi:hypothetical protein
LKDLKIGIFGIIGILVLVLAVSGCTSSDNSTTSQNTAPPVNTTISGLYNNAPSVGTNVQVSGTVFQAGGDFLIIENSNSQMVYVSLDSSNTKTAYENQKVKVVGSFEGPHQYETASSAARSIPGITNAKIS